MRKCAKCTIEKDLAEFPKDKQNLSGYRVYCKECSNRMNALNRYKRGRKVVKYSDDKQRLRDLSKRMYKLHPEKHRARYAVANALKNGSLKKNNCHCGEVKVEAHHPDYKKPLQVMWLCRKHHKEIHRKYQNHE